MTNVLALWVAVGGIVILDNVYYDLWNRPYTPLWVWIGVSGAVGLAAALLLDYANSRSHRRRNRILWFGLGGMALAWFVASFIFYEVDGPAEWARGGDAPMLTVSFVVGAVVGLSLRVMGALGGLQRIWEA